MKGTKIMMVVVIILVAMVGLGLAGIMLLGINGALPNMGGWLAEPELVNEQSWSADEINSLVVAYGSDSIRLLPSDDGRVVLKEYMSRHDDEMLARTSLADGSLSIRAGNRPWSIGLLMWRTKIELYVPASWACDVTLETGSGSLRAESDFSFAGFAAKSGSGSIRLAGVESETISLDSGSGSITAERLLAAGQVNLAAHSGSIKPGEVEAGGIRAEAGSGSIRFEQAVAGIVEAETDSGSITFERLDGAFDLNAGSGGVRVESGSGQGLASAGSGSVTLRLESLMGDVRLKSGSGGCRLSLPESSAFNLQTHTGSGGVHVPEGGNLQYDADGDVTSGSYGESPSYTVSMESGSGSVRLEFD